LIWLPLLNDLTGEIYMKTVEGIIKEKPIDLAQLKQT